MGISFENFVTNGGSYLGLRFGEEAVLQEGVRSGNPLLLPLRRVSLAEAGAREIASMKRGNGWAC